MMLRNITVKSDQPQQVAERSIRNVGEEILTEKVARLQAYMSLLEHKLKTTKSSQDKEKLNQLISDACDTLKEVVSVPV